jgi:hypothetical protein
MLINDLSIYPIGIYFIL